ncbi:MAG TPA: DinB family protein [Thermoanaerobaculia bacterium]|nr:DinB family protein [Thermoanaerobaculia bacterium]
MNRPSGRPQPGEYAPYAQDDVALVQGEDAGGALAAQLPETLALLSSVDERRATRFRYAPRKWTIKQIVGHLSDDERIFVYRMLCLARGDRRVLRGFDEKAYMRRAGFNDRPFSELLDELSAVRAATLAFLRGLPDEAWARSGTVNGYPATVRGLAFHVAGHELHHRRILRERYLAG